jgi:hypothetical protein
MIYLSESAVMFTGVLVYVGQALSVLPVSDVRTAAAAFLE